MGMVGPMKMGGASLVSGRGPGDGRVFGEEWSRAYGEKGGVYGAGKNGAPGLWPGEVLDTPNPLPLLGCVRWGNGLHHSCLFSLRKGPAPLHPHPLLLP